MRKAAFVLLAVIICLSLVPIMTMGCEEEVKEVTVGNKNFTEEYVIGQLMKQALEEEGFTVTLVSDLSTMALREGMEAGDIDICADYTGTAWMTHLGHEYTPGVDNNEIYEMVKDEDAGNGFIWLDAIWNNNTYVLVSWPDFVEANNLTTISDLAALYSAGKVEVKTFVGFEFSTRPDGLPALEKHYNFKVPEDSLMTGAPGASLLGLENHECPTRIAPKAGWCFAIGTIAVTTSSVSPAPRRSSKWFATPRPSTSRTRRCSMRTNTPGRRESTSRPK